MNSHPLHRATGHGRAKNTAEALAAAQEILSEADLIRAAQDHLRTVANLRGLAIDEDSLAGARAELDLTAAIRDYVNRSVVPGDRARGPELAL